MRTGIIMLENPNVMLLQTRYNNRFDNSVTLAECQRRNGTLSISLFLTALSQTLVPVAFLSQRSKFRLERNLLRRDEVVRKRYSCGVVLCGLPDLGRSVTFPVFFFFFFLNLLSSRLIVDSWRWKCRATSLADMSAVSILMALSRCSNVSPGRRGMTFYTDFQIRKLSNCVLCDPRGIVRFAVHILHVIFINIKVNDYIMA